MDPVTMGLVAGAGLGLAKGLFIDPQKEAQQRQEQAAIARYSPWTGMRPNVGAIQRADPFGSAMQGGMAGAQLGQAYDASSQFGNAASTNPDGLMVPGGQPTPVNNQSGVMTQSDRYNPWLNMQR